MKPFLLCLLCLLFCDVHGCWFSSKKGALEKIKHHFVKIGKDPKDGLTKHDFENIVNDLPSYLRWVVKKVGNIDGIMQRCDTNKDGVIHFHEAKKADKCFDGCWKSLAVEKFLN